MFVSSVENELPERKKMTKQELIDKIINRLLGNVKKTIFIDNLCKLARGELFRWSKYFLMFYYKTCLERDGTLYGEKHKGNEKRLP